MSFKFTKSNLNFDVYTVASKPTAPGANNDIAIITSVPMPNWIMSPDKPSGRPRSDGDVWIQYSVSGNTFNALKNNTMMIATISAWQYVDGAWVKVEAVSCQNGEWVNWWNGELFDKGDQYESVTGGWIQNSNLRYDSSHANTGAVNIDDTITLNPSTSSQSAVATTKNPVDLTNFTTLTVEPASGSQAYWVYVHKITSGNLESNYSATSGKVGTDSGATTSSVNITSLSGEYYISVATQSTRKAIIEKIKLS